jgi:hypothetical protein
MASQPFELIPLCQPQTGDGPTVGVPTLAPAADRAQAYARAAKAPATRRGYASDWRQFSAWCERAGLSSLPAEPRTVALYIADLAESRRPATISRHMAAIAAGHKAVGLESPALMRHGAVASRYGRASGERMGLPRTRKRRYWLKTCDRWSAVSVPV